LAIICGVGLIFDFLGGLKLSCPLFEHREPKMGAMPPSPRKTMFLVSSGLSLW
jgi:hypothetical protein